MSHMQYPMLFQYTVISFEFIWNFPSSIGDTIRCFLHGIVKEAGSDSKLKWHTSCICWTSFHRWASIDNSNYPVWIILKVAEDLIIWTSILVLTTTGEKMSNILLSEAWGILECKNCLNTGPCSFLCDIKHKPSALQLVHSELMDSQRRPSRYLGSALAGWSLIISLQPLKSREND